MQNAVNYKLHGKLHLVSVFDKPSSHFIERLRETMKKWCWQKVTNVWKGILITIAQLFFFQIPNDSGLVSWLHWLSWLSWLSSWLSFDAFASAWLFSWIFNACAVPNDCEHVLQSTLGPRCVFLWIYMYWYKMIEKTNGMQLTIKYDNKIKCSIRVLPSMCYADWSTSRTTDICMAWFQNEWLHVASVALCW